MSKADLDRAVLEYLRDPERCTGGAACWVIAKDLNEPRGNVAAALHRLKADGRVRYNGPVRRWEAT